MNNNITRNNNKRTNAKAVNLLMIALTFHLFSVQSKLLFHLNPEMTETVSFSYGNFTEPTILSVLFALAYSLATISVLTISKKRGLILIFASLDAVGVLLYYLPNLPVVPGAIYYALYTGTLIISTLYLDKPEYLSDQIKEMKNNGISQREIAQQLDISESKVSRLLKRVSGQNGNLAKSKSNGSINAV